MSEEGNLDEFIKFIITDVRHITNHSLIFIIISCLKIGDVKSAIYWIGRFVAVFGNEPQFLFDQSALDTAAACRLRRAELEAHIERAAKAQRIGEAPRPSYFRHLLRRPLVDIQRFRGLRIAFLFDQYVYKSKFFVEDALPFIFMNSAKSVGFEAKHFPLDNIVTYEWSDQRRQSAQWFLNKIDQLKNMQNIKKT